MAGPGRCRGAALLLAMFLVAAMGILLAVAGRVWQTEARRDREAQLLFVGAEFARALARYRAATPPGQPGEPARLDQLLADDRHPVVRRHLRRIYRDPITGSADWGLLKARERIVGVHSLGSGVPLKRSGFAASQVGFAGATSYAAWVFGADAAAVQRP